MILRSKPLRGVSSAENAFCDTVGKFLGKHASRKVILVVAGATLLKSLSSEEITFFKEPPRKTASGAFSLHKS